MVPIICHILTVLKRLRLITQCRLGPQLPRLADGVCDILDFLIILILVEDGTVHDLASIITDHLELNFRNCLMFRC